MMADRPPDLAPCPFCGDAGEFREDEQHLAPRMSGPGALITVTLRHWCPKLPGALQVYHEVRARDRATAVAQWNGRVDPQRCRYCSRLVACLADNCPLAGK